MKRFKLFNAAISFSNTSFSSVSSLNRFLRLRREPFSNMAMAFGWRVQKAPLPRLVVVSPCLATLMKQSLKLRLCRNEFCQRCVLLL